MHIVRYTQFRDHIPLFFVLETHCVCCEVGTARPGLIGVLCVSKRVLYGDHVCPSVAHSVQTFVRL